MSSRPTAGAVLYAKNPRRVSDFYTQSTGLTLIRSEQDHVILESGAFQLVILAIPELLAASITIATPPVRREATPIKLVLYVESIAAVRECIASVGGRLNPHDREWFFQGSKVCDGCDPEGNVVQFRESAP